MADDIQVVVTEGPPVEVVVAPEPDTTVTVALSPPVQTVEVAVPGPAGPPGEPGSGGGVTDHGALTGLADDDHGHYHTNARGDARYSILGHEHDHIANLETDSRLITDSPSSYPVGFSVMPSTDDGLTDGFATEWSDSVQVETLVIDAGSAVQNVNFMGFNVASATRRWNVGDLEWSEWVELVDWGSLPSTFPPTTFTHTQTLASTTWTVDHGLGRKPTAVSIIDSGGNEVEGEIQHTSLNQFLAIFEVAFSGEALYI